MALTGEGIQCPPGWAVAPGALSRMSYMDWVHASCLFLLQLWPRQLYLTRKGRRVTCMHPIPGLLKTESHFLVGSHPRALCHRESMHEATGVSPTGQPDLAPDFQEATGLRTGQTPTGGQVWDDWFPGERCTQSREHRACLPTSPHSCLPISGVSVWAPPEAEPGTKI